MATPTAIASSSSSHGNTNSHVYEVFLNHRGPDQKKRLASQIYRRLIVRGLNVFLDQPELEKGEDTRTQINEAIRTASVHVALFSPTYAQSHWCLDELAEMLESGSAIIPVFIDVDSSELRWTRSGDGVHSIIRCICPCLLREKGRYARDLEILEKKRTFNPDTNEDKPRHDSATLERWRNALSVVSYKSGFVMDAYNGCGCRVENPRPLRCGSRVENPGFRRTNDEAEGAALESIRCRDLGKGEDMASVSGELRRVGTRQWKKGFDAVTLFSK